MRTAREIQQRLHGENDAFAIEVLRWVLDGGCPMCDHKSKKDYELGIMNEEFSATFLEVRHNWNEGVVMNHMDNHIEFDALQAKNMEEDRQQTISTLDAAEDIVIRIQNYLNELEVQKEAAGGISSEFVSDAAKLIGQANSSLKLVGQLKKEIGVDSQLMLAQAQVNDMSRILIEVLGSHPQLLDQVELKMALLKEPSVIIDG
jgi:hypothetical protein|tara:strand:- start:12750 stop:13358 length:609 start_codon:yes stop_codon:yes gene_type:complete